MSADVIDQLPAIVNKLDFPPVSSPVDAEVDLEVLRAIPKQFTIDSERAANWLLKKISAARLHAQRAKEWYEQEVRRAERTEATLLFLYERQAEAWAKSEIERLGGRRKSIALPAGTLGFRTINPSLQVTDEDRVLVWAQAHCPEAVEVVKKLSRSVLKEHFQKTGEVPDQGAYVESSHEKFYIR